ncbi:hypothetical protein [Aquamicrobium zhengzhouense]|uniref:Uncharacterized protein n=1 Tax=Aquamicrobium zhengzhouense TaxID=2781738 RepID=A0ABS0SCL1_9HYPH|nr:hypothetical protein [Aquamicrobium zhengzhouense]MBI1621042.1 hypothetical protein [Aquamicrobium zhengzhouense]
MSGRRNIRNQDAPSKWRERKALIVAAAIIIAITAAYFAFDFGFRTAPDIVNNDNMRAVDAEEMQPAGQ